jgi:hypothetical protein
MEKKKGTEGGKAVVSPEEFEQMEMYDKKKVLESMLEEVKLPECYGRYPTRHVTEDDGLEAFQGNVQRMARCKTCPERELCFRHSLLYHLDNVFRL